MQDKVQKSDVGGKQVPGMFDGPLRPLLIRLALPMMMGMLFNIAYTTADTFFISSIDKTNPAIIGGPGLIFPLVFLFIGAANGIMIGVSSLVSRAIGERSREVIERIADSGLLLALSLGLISVVLGYLAAEPIVTRMGARGEYAVYALEYFRWLLPGLGLMLAVYVFIGVIQGEGQVRYMMRSMIIGNLLNILLDPLFIFDRVWIFPGLGLGIRGAALATVAGQGIAAVYIIWVFASGRTLVPVSWDLRKARLRLIGKIISIGLPQALAHVFMSFSFLVFNRILIDIDPKTVAAASLCGRIDQIVFTPIFALSSALMTTVGQNMGRGLLPRAREAWKTGLIMSLVTVFAASTLMVAAAPAVYRLFSSDPDVLRYTVLQTWIVEYSFLFVAAAIMGRSVFQANGRAWIPLIITTLRMLILAVPFVLLFTWAFDWGIYGVWAGIIAGNGLGAFFALGLVRRYWNRLESGKVRYVQV